MIELQNIQGFTIEQIVDLLLDQNEQPFQVYIPKSTQLFFSEQAEVAADYAYLAYAGHLLRQVADSFECEEVAPEDHASVLFKIGTEDISALAEQLLFISCYDINEHEDEEFIFWEEIEQYLEEIANGKIEVACSFYYETYLSLVSAEESEE